MEDNTLSRTGPETAKDGRCTEEIGKLWDKIKKTVAKRKVKEKRQA